MRIKRALRERDAIALTIRAKRNYFETSEKPLYAQASCSDIVECEDFIDRMAASRTVFSKPDMLAVFELVRGKFCELLADGRYVKIPLGAALPVAKGNMGVPRPKPSGLA